MSGRVYNKLIIKHHHPKKLPVKLNPQEFYIQLTETGIELGNLNGLLKNLPNPKILIAPLLVKEATTSSKIEGTRSTVAEVLKYEATGVYKYDDAKEVSNYKKAMLMAINGFKKRPISLSFIKTLHQILLEGTQAHKFRGKFRKDIVWVGSKNAPIEKATYVPPEPFLVKEYMQNLGEYILNEEDHPLVKIAIIHYQFEAIHPFNDGNGRIGRILIPLYLYWKGLLRQPVLYISGYFEKNRDEYLYQLHKVDVSDKYEEWLRFFFISIKKQAKETQKLISKIIELKNETEQICEKLKSPYVNKVINAIFPKPIFKSKDIPLKGSTARRILNRMTNLSIIRTLKVKGIKGKVYIFDKLVRLLSY